MPRLCSPHHSPLPPLHLTSTPSSAQAMPLSRSTVLKRRFYLEPATMNSPRSHPTSCAVSTEGASSTAAISGHRRPSISPPQGPHQRPGPLQPTSQCWTAPPVSSCPPDLPQIGSLSHHGALVVVPPQASSPASPNWPGAAAQRHRLGYSAWDGPHTEMASPLDELGRAISRSGPSAQCTFTFFNPFV
jgi:hypothetical protein